MTMAGECNTPDPGVIIARESTVSDTDAGSLGSLGLLISRSLGGRGIFCVPASERARIQLWCLSAWKIIGDKRREDLNDKQVAASGSDAVGRPAGELTPMHSAVIHLSDWVLVQCPPGLQRRAKDTAAIWRTPRVISQGAGFSHEITGRPIPKEGKTHLFNTGPASGGGVPLWTCMAQRPMRKLIGTARWLSAGQLLIVDPRTTPVSPLRTPRPTSHDAMCQG